MVDDEEEVRRQEEYSNFVDLLNKLRREDKITPEYRRDLDKQWRKYPEKRALLLQQLKELAKSYTQV